MSRHSDAISAQLGACNPIAVSAALARATKECSELGMDTDAIRADPAVRLIAHQMAYLAGLGDAVMEGYCQALETCERACGSRS